jgi:hypothetical protein
MVPLLVSLAVMGASGFCDAEACVTAPAARTEVSAEAGLLSTGYLHGTGYVADSFAFAGAAARIRTQALSWLLVEVGADGLAPLSRDGSKPGAAGVARVGYAGSTFAFGLGVNAHVDDTPSPVAVLPSFALTYRPGPVAVTVGVFDRPVGPIAHVNLEVGSFSLGYSAPLGFDAFARVRLTPTTALQVGVFGYQAFGAFYLGGSVALVFGEGSTYQFQG